MSESTVPDGHVEKVGGFDIRNFIGLLIGIYGLVLTVMGLFFFDEAARAKTADLNANLWTGLAMLAFGALFVLWARLRPIRIVVKENEPGAEERRDIAPTD
ncbi:hypothetical protein DT076_10265 [Desertihabitans brevis]|uniref:Uncharacterized protein n=1 Tax=Desertihabitans brevis TaxID=2268447 RepID=A0A367YV99_9ACTN|nr:hypothetical protein [Desertihabitans brevis]RCK69803.1 hypothetical protein DT076_10265 [Desertihabitans brevis]